MVLNPTICSKGIRLSYFLTTISLKQDKNLPFPTIESEGNKSARRHSPLSFSSKSEHCPSVWFSWFRRSDTKCKRKHSYLTSLLSLVAESYTRQCWTHHWSQPDHERAPPPFPEVVLSALKTVRFHSTYGGSAANTWFNSIKREMRCSLVTVAEVVSLLFCFSFASFLTWLCSSVAVRTEKQGNNLLHRNIFSGYFSIVNVDTKFPFTYSSWHLSDSSLSDRWHISAARPSLT